ncbi:hypothetical protein [Siphonobacter sp. BAB-5385]|uniref:hypothetical protein n=1 Tax=Siphonobacter sp. BAB-5385 TaxID=1864822 RepID=UPI0020CB9200|nr:hypothetical protein [Siphonobacter sp. BAB-5385]
MKGLLTLAFQLLFFLSYAQQNLVPYVRPLIGTEKMGHTFPGATVPFGAVQLSPDTDTILTNATVSIMVMCIDIVRATSTKTKPLWVSAIRISVVRVTRIWAIFW